MNSKLRYFLVTSIGVILILLVIELVSFIIYKAIYNRKFDSSLIIDNKYLSSSGLKENANGIVWGKKFQTDEFGGRKNAKYDSRKKKWFFIGDSVTQGVGVGDIFTFSSICSNQFSQFNILNLSLIGYSTYDYYNVISSVLQKDTSVELITLFFCINDAYGNSKTNTLPVMAKQNLIGKINSFLQDRYITYKLIKLFFYSNSNHYFQYDSQFYKTDNPRFQESMSYLMWCDSICKSKNILFQVVMLPYKSQLKNYSVTNIPQKCVKEFCDSNSIPFSDAAEFMSKQTDINSLYLFADEIHFSEKGHLAIAKFLVE
jgi:lysophospholipase L1-like esterase